MIALFLPFIICNTVFAIHINARTFQALLPPGKITKEHLLTGRFEFISKFIFDPQLTAALSSNFGIDHSQFVKGIYILENSLKEPLSELPGRVGIFGTIHRKIY